MRIAGDIAACEDLLNGAPVDESRLDPKGLAWALQMRFTRLDFAAIDEFYGLLREAEDSA
jgi:hypothetical protein